MLDHRSLFKSWRALIATSVYFSLSLLMLNRDYYELTETLFWHSLQLPDNYDRLFAAFIR